MKKLLLGLFLFSVLSFAEGNTVETRFGLDLQSDSKLKATGEDPVNLKFTKRGFEIGAEYRKDLSSGFEAGVGIFYKRNGYRKNFKEDVVFPILDDVPVSSEFKGFHSLPIYATLRYNFLTSSDIKPYIKANLGYSINSGTAKVTYSDNTSTWPSIKGTVDDEYRFKNGIYYGIGTGIEYKNFTVDLSYNVLRSKFENTWISTVGRLGTHVLESSTETGKINNRYLTLSFGYNFKF